MDKEVGVDKEKLESTLLITEAMSGELTDYLLGDNLYRQLIVKTPEGTKQPKMTLGALLENVELLKAAAASMTPEQLARLRVVEGQVDLARGAFADQWQEWLRREARANLGSWRWYLDDIARSKSAQERYASEARIRTRLALVMQQLRDDPDMAEDRRELAELDRQLRSMFEGGSYVGLRDEEVLLPADQAWWLYGKPRPATE
jgi:hypothetical protein